MNGSRTALSQSLQDPGLPTSKPGVLGPFSIIVVSITALIGLYSAGTSDQEEETRKRIMACVTGIAEGSEQQQAVLQHAISRIDELGQAFSVDGSRKEKDANGGGRVSAATVDRVANRGTVSETGTAPSPYATEEEKWKTLPGDMSPNDLLGLDPETFLKSSRFNPEGLSVDSLTQQRIAAVFVAAKYRIQELQNDLVVSV